MDKLKRKLQTPSIRSGALVAMLGIAVVFGLTVKLASRASVALPSDINNDGIVNVFDLSTLLSNWGRSGAGDINSNNIVDVFDLSSLLSSWGKTAQTTTPTPTITHTPTPTPTLTATATPSGQTLQLNDATVGTGLNQFNFTGNWLVDAPAAAFNGDNHYSNTSGNYYQVQFNGTQAKIYSEKSPGQGIVGVSVDGGAETMVDAYASARVEQQLLYTSPVLASGGSHILKVRITGTKNASASGMYTAADRVDILNAVVTPTPVGWTPTPVPYCGGKTPCYGPADLAKHTSFTSCWGYNLSWMLDLTKYAPAHPDGSSKILTTAVCGKDVAPVLKGQVSSNGTHYHRSDTINNTSASQLNSYRVGYYDPTKP